MDNFTLLKNALIRNNGGNINSSLLVSLTDTQLNHLITSSGSAESEMRQVNSSTGLAVNFWRALELSSNGLAVDFEWKKRKPLRYGEPANIDVVCQSADRISYIESKYLEPYYSGNEYPSLSYLHDHYYTKNTKDSASSWISLFEKASSFKLYNVVQLSRHLLAICQDIWRNPEYYHGKQVDLLSVTWEMTESFVQILPFQSDFADRTFLIREESEIAESLLNDFIKSHIPETRIVFQSLRYNHLIDKLIGSKYYTPIKDKYFL